MTITEPLHCQDEVAAASGFAMLQLQVNVSNSSSALEEDDILMDVLMQQQAFVAKSWASVVEVAQKSEVHIPLWTMICSLVLLGVLLFYLVNYMLAAQRERSQRQHDLEDAKKHSEHGNMLGSLIEAAIEHFDEQLLGVNVDFGAVKVTVGEGVVAVHDLTLENPYGFWSPYFVHIGELLVDIDLQAFMTSMGRQVVIERLQLRDVDVIWEGGLVSSNLRHFLKLLQGDKAKTPRPASAAKDGVQTTVQEVLAEGMTLKIANYWLCGCGPCIMAEDFYTTNFEENLALSIPEMLVTTILSSVLASVLGRDVARILMEGTSSGLRFFADCFWHFVAICGYALRCCSRQRQGQPVQAKPRKAKPKAAAKQSSSCGNCGNCLPCEALLARRPGN